MVVVGHGMVGHRLVEALRARDTDGSWRITVLAEETDAAYDRVGLTSYTESWDRALLALPGNDYAGDEQVRLLLNARVTEIDRATKSVLTADGQRHSYDALVLATGSYAFVPPVPGHDLPGCHVYRTLDDLDAIRAAAELPATAAMTPRASVIGGGLLGLEAANALRQFGLQTHVIEMMPRLMAQQIDEGGGALLARMVTDLGIVGACRHRYRRDPSRPAIRRFGIDTGAADRRRGHRRQRGDLRGRHPAARRVGRGSRA